ncbi:MAG: heme ABC exporter ATP-binding protein CcmA [Spirochaetae bacterium HGW-Spirochaetae-1]|jgi:ABC-type multidrug transport system ATPase subunit|nr:MAG: heme ABC exporter ATP-binding protein CcmA [Spirochaetae bacterium HGW-Spirochaetae-1]
MPVIIKSTNIAKKFNRMTLFRDISFSLSAGQSLSLTGRNGSGKSTLLKIIAGITSPSSGSMTYALNGAALGRYDFFSHIGFISPVMNVYEELTGLENLRFVGGVKDDDRSLALLDRFELRGHENKPVRLYSSGMKQRLKLACCLLNDPPVLLLDEPGMNLDRKGRDIIYSYLDSVREDRIIIIATNENEEAALCRGRIDLDH